MSKNGPIGPLILLAFLLGLNSLNAQRLSSSEAPRPYPTVQFTWRETPLKDSLARLVLPLNQSVLVDRRIDPHLPVTREQPPTPLDGAMEALAHEHGWALSRLENSLYLGPPATARELATIIAIQQRKIDRLPKEVRQRWQARKETHWSDLTEPSSLVSAWMSERQLKIDNLDRIPHDLWAAQTLAPLPLLEQLTLVLAGFDLTVQVNAQGDARIVPLPRNAHYTQTYRVSGKKPLPEKWPRQEPRDSVRIASGRWTVRGSAEFHQQVQRYLRGTSSRLAPDASETIPQPRPQSLDRQRFTLRVQNQPLRSILQAVAQQTHSQLEWQGTSESWSGEPRSLSVQNATFEELMAKLLDGLPMTARWEDSVIQLQSSAPAPENR